MKALHSKIPCAVVFANFFLWSVGLFLPPCTLRCQSLLSNTLSALPDASGATAMAGTASRASPALPAADSCLLAAWVTPSRFGLQELSSGSLLFAQSQEAYAWGCEITGLGNLLYNELSATGFFSLPVSESFGAGAALTFSRLAIRDAPVLTALQVHLGAVLHLTPEFSAGMALHNITRAGFGDDDRSIDQRALLSFGLELTPGLTAAAGVYIRINRASSLLATVLHTIGEGIQLRAGIQTWPRSAEGGVTWSAGTFTFSGLLQYHDELGFSQQIGGLYHW